MANTSIGSSGPIRFSTLKSVFGTTGPVRFSMFKRDNVYVPNISANTNIPTTFTNMRLKKFYNSTVIQTITLPTGNTVNFNLLTSITTTYGNVTTVKKNVKLIIPSGAIVGSTVSTSPALDIGQFPTGTIIEIENNGSIQGAGGLVGAGGTVYGAAANTTGGPYSGGKGGDAIKASYLNQTVTITNNGTIYAGGGGGGGGAAGITVVNETRYNDVANMWYVHTGWATFTAANWDNINVFKIDNNTTITSSAPYSRGAYRATTSGNTAYLGSWTKTQYEVIKNISNTINAGGNGAFGRGYNNNTLTAGATGTSGITGGNGGAFGASGTASSASPGAAGYYLVKGSASVTLIGGTTAGLLG